MKTNSTHLALVLFICVFLQAMAFSGPNAFDVPKGEAEKIKAKVNSGEISSQAIAFTENKGQVYDQNYKVRPDVLYGAMVGNLAVHIKKTGVSYQLCRVDMFKEVEDPKTREKHKEIDQQTIYRIDLTWINANKNFTKTEDEALPGYNNYYLESCPNGALNVRSFKGINLHNLYQGINLHYYEKQGELKHDYIVAPHADYKQIQLKVEGAEISINKDGTLTLKTVLGKVQEGAPIVYQRGKKLKAFWRLEKDVLSFDVENYDSNYELIIDPVTRLWGTYYGGSGSDFGNACSADAAGNVYMTGYTELNTATVIATAGAHQTICGGGEDAFLVKFNNSGARLWGTYYGGTASDIGFSCFTDAPGNIYMAGSTDSNTGTAIATLGAHQSNYGGNTDAFLAKFNSSGLRQWGTYYGGSGFDYGYSCTVDTLGNVYMSGFTSSNTGTVIANNGAQQNTFGGGSSDAFLVKFSGGGVQLWGTYCGGAGTDQSFFCSLDPSGNIYMAGWTSSNTGTLIASPGSHQSTFGGGFADAFLVKYNTSGTQLWGTYYGGSGDDRGRACSADASGNVYFSGYTSSSTGTIMATTGAHQSTLGGSNDAFLVKFDSFGTRIWGTYYGGNMADYGFSCFADASGNIYLAGTTNSGTGTIIATTGAHQSTYGGGGVNDAFIVKFNNIGIRLWGSYYGDTSTEYGRSCFADNFGNVYMSGETASNSGTAIANTGAHQNTYGGGYYDAFLVKLSDCVALTPTASVSSSVCSGASIHFSCTHAGTGSPVYLWSGPNSFTASIQNPTITNASTIHIGIYTLNINNSGCVETTTTQISSINPSPSITVNNGTICSGESFTIMPSGANTYTFQGGNSVVSPNTSASYTVSGSSSDGCVSANTATSNVHVNPLPAINITATSSVICLGESIDLSATGANSYTWSTGSNGSSITVSPVITTTYSVTGQDANACENTSAFTLQVDECTGIANTLKSEAGIVLYPNPNNGEFYIESPSDFDIKIYNSLGQLILQRKLNEGKNQINLNEHANGIYFIEINQNGKTNRIKLIKE